MNNRLKNKMIITFGATAVAGALIIIFIIYPATKTILAISRETLAEKNTLEKRSSQGSDITQSQAVLENIEGSLTDLDNIFIKKNQELDFITRIESIATASNVEININSDFIGQKVSSTISQIPMQMNVTGAFPATINFLSRLEQLPYYYNISIIMISPKIKTGDKTTVVLQLTGQTYLK